MVNDVDEKVTITIDEEPIEYEDEKKMKEIKIELNTGQSMEASYITPIITGELKSIIISNNEPMDIEISSSYEYVLFEESQRVGTHYFPLKVTALNYKAKQFNYVADNYWLDEILRIVVKGPRNATMNIILRYC